MSSAEHTWTKHPEHIFCALLRSLHKRKQIKLKETQRLLTHRDKASAQVVCRFSLFLKYAEFYKQILRRY